MAKLGENVANRSDLKKDKLRFMVVTNDTDAMAEALDEFHQAVQGKGPLSRFSRPIDKFLRAFKAFDEKYHGKHPKFIAELKDQYEKPIRAVLAKMEELAHALPTADNALVEAEKKLEEVAANLRKPPRTEKEFDEVLDSFAVFGRVMNNGLADLGVIGRSFGYPELEALRLAYHEKGMDKVQQGFDIAVKDAKKKGSIDTTEINNQMKTLAALAKYCNETRAELKQIVD